jgi:hypothetical protein
MPLRVLPVDDNAIDIRLSQSVLAVSGIEYDVCATRCRRSEEPLHQRILGIQNKLSPHSHHPIPAGRTTERAL